LHFAVFRDGISVQFHGVILFSSGCCPVKRIPTGGILKQNINQFPGLRRWFRLHSSDPLGVHEQQHDPANERERSNDRRNKVADCGFEMHSKEVNGLSRSREGDARVSEHHNAQSDQKDRNNGFCIHIESLVYFG